MTASLLEIDCVSFHHGRRRVLDDVSFSASAGEFVAVVGVNGAGKSTLLDLIAGIRRPDTGEIRIGGRGLGSFSGNQIARRVSHLPQTIHADLPFTGGQVVAMGRYPHTDRWFESEEDQRLILAAMERTGCTRFRDRAFATLSGGERQRVLLAACLAQDAAIQLLDEPSTFLDIEAQLECFALLQAEARRGKLAVAVTHDLNLALTYATRLVLLEGGRLVRQIACAEATQVTDWIRAFSPRLRMGADPGGDTVGLVRMSDARRAAGVIGLAAGVFVLAAAALPWVGAGPVDVGRVWRHQSPDYEILLQLRLSRTLLALLAGGALSLAGALFQAMLRDALATPYTLGISAGASLGAVVAISAGWTTLFGIPSVWLGSLVGALAVLVLVVGATFGERRLSAFTLLLTGIAVNSICAAFILILSAFAGVARSFSIARWLIGSVDSTGYASLAVLAVVVALAAGFIVAQARSWNLLAVGEQWAISRGVRVGRLMGSGFLAGSALVAGAIALTGPIGFVGLIVPHLVRSRVSPDHRILMPCSFLLGGAMLAACDALGRVVLAPAEVPAGAIVALIGGPYLVWVVRSRVPGEG